MQKGQAFIFLLVGIVVLAAIGGAFYLGRSTTSKSSPAPAVTSQTPPPTSTNNPVPNGTGETANWKTYRGKYFTFRHPLDSISLKDLGSEVANLDNLNNSGKKIKIMYAARVVLQVPLKTDYPNIYGTESTIFSADVIDNQENISSNDFIEKVLAPTSFAPVTDFKFEYTPFTVDGIQGLKFGFPYQGGMTREILVQKGSNLYHFILQPTDTITEETLYVIISTFRFDSLP